MLKPCMEGFDQLKRLVNAIAHIDIKKIAMKILMHPGDFLKDITKAIECFGKSDMKCAGKCIGDILRMLFLTTAEVDPYDFVKGFLEAIHETKTVEDLKKCLTDINPIIEKIKLALELFLKMTFDDIMKGMKILIEALHDLEEMLKPCLNEFKQVQKLMDAVKNINIIKVVTKILMNPGAFINDVKDCIESLKSQNFYQAGKDIGDILYRLFLTRRQFDPKPIVDFSNGFLKGIHEIKSVDDLVKCVKEADHILENIQKALELIKTLNIEKMLEGLTMLFEALYDLEEMLRPCLGEYSQFRKLVEAIMNMDINEVVQKIVANTFQFIADIVDCIQAFQRSNFVQAGRDLGDIMYRLFLISTEDQFDPVAFIKGLLEGLNEKGDINNLLKCVKDLESIVNKIMEALEYIKKKDFANIIKGITMLIEAVTHLMQVLTPCAEGFEQIKKLINAISHVDIMKLVFKIIGNPGPYISDVMNCIDNFKKQDFHGAGKNLGDLLFRLFLTSRL
jgi:cellobiose-specific phosphotransferase system component IIA